MQQMIAAFKEGQTEQGGCDAPCVAAFIPGDYFPHRIQSW